MHPQKILQKIPSSPAGPQWKKPHRILPLRKNVLARASSTLLPEPQPGSSSAVVCDSTRQIRAVTAALEGPGWWQGGRSGDFATPGPPAQHLASLQTGSSWLGGEFIPVEADVGREEVSKSSLEDGQKSVCLCGRSGDPTCHVARSGEGSQQCPARGFGSGHLDVRGEVCMPWVWHLQGFCSERADLRKSPQMYVLPGAGSREASLPKTPRRARSVASANPPPLCGSREGDFSGEGLAPALLEMREV